MKVARFEKGRADLIRVIATIVSTFVDEEFVGRPWDRTLHLPGSEVVCIYKP